MDTPVDLNRWVVLSVANPIRATGLACVAAGLARARQVGVLVVNVETSGTSSLGYHQHSSPQNWPALATAVNVLRDSQVPVAWLVCANPDVGEVLRRIAVDMHASMVVLGWRGKAEAGEDIINATLKEVLQDPVADIVVVGGEVSSRFHRILVPVGSGPHSQLAIALALNLVEKPSERKDASEPPVTVMHILPPATYTGNSFKARRSLSQALGRFEGRTDIVAKVVVSHDIAQAVLNELKSNYDLVIMGTSREALIDRLLFGDVPQRVAEKSDVTVIVTRSHLPAIPRVVRHTWHSIASAMPNLTSMEQAEVQQEVTEGARSRVDFFMMMGLAAVLASLGLLLDSPAVIIGAMLVAPLMSAIMGLGLGIVGGDSHLLRMAIGTTIRGILLAVIVGLVLAWAIPGASPTAEVLSRTQPNLLDLGVALTAGTAGAYAVCRKGVAAALAGVAIAAALVPPLTTIGLGLGFGRVDIAAGATLLFTTNLVAITAASAIVFLLVGFSPPDALKIRRQLFQRSLRGITLLLLAISVVLGLLTFKSLYTARLNRDLGAVIGQQVISWPDSELVDFTVATDLEDVLNVSIVIRSTEQPPRDSVRKLQTILAARMGRPVALTLSVVPTLHFEPVSPPD